MPIYEYHCNGCRKRVSLLVRSITNPPRPTCPKCGGRDMARLLSRFAVVRSEESRLESLADPTKFGDLDESDPKSVARWAKRMGKELGEDLGEDFDDMMEGAMDEEAAGDLTNGEDD